MSAPVAKASRLWVAGAGRPDRWAKASEKKGWGSLEGTNPMRGLFFSNPDVQKWKFPFSNPCRFEEFIFAPFNDFTFFDVIFVVWVVFEVKGS